MTAGVGGEAGVASGPRAMRDSRVELRRMRGEMAMVLARATVLPETLCPTLSCLPGMARTETHLEQVLQVLAVAPLARDQLANAK